MTTFVKPAQVMVLACTLLALAGPAQSQEKASREREALRRVQQALRVAQDEQSTLQRDKAKLATEKESISRDMSKLDGELKRTASKVGSAQAEARAAQARSAQLDTELTGVKVELEALKLQHEEQGRKLQDTQGRVLAVTALLERSTQAQALLEARNQQLYKVGVSAVELYRSRRPAETLARQEPVFGMAAVTIENVAEAWLDRLEEARFKEDVKTAP
ncbi:MAG: hypothetical protein V4532_02710 [Pseudomonadota bacterium]